MLLKGRQVDCLPDQQDLSTFSIEPQGSESGSDDACQAQQAVPFLKYKDGRDYFVHYAQDQHISVS